MFVISANATLTYRLVEGRNNKSGFVQVFNPGISKWGAICGDGWNLYAADVLCKYFGYPWALEAFTGPPKNETDIFIPRLACKGGSEYVDECVARSWRPTFKCSRSVAGIICLEG